MDGARLFNAAIEQAHQNHSDPGDEARSIALKFNSVSVCFSKGLGAPVGSAVCGTRDFIVQAKRIRKMLGGSMRQAGILASAASYALTHHFYDLYKDHVLAEKLADGLRDIRGITVVRCATNMVFARLEQQGSKPMETIQKQFLSYLKMSDILVSDSYELRFVTHRDVNSQGIEHTLSTVQNFFK